LSPSASTPIRLQRFSHQFIRGDDEDAVGHRIGHVDHSKISTGSRLSDGNPRLLLTRSIFARLPEHVLDLTLPHFMLEDVR